MPASDHPSSSPPSRDRLTLGLCTYNRGAKIRTTLDAIDRLDPADGRLAEVIVVDNNSNDETARVVDEFIAARTETGGAFPIRRVFEAEPGKTNAIERLFREARTPIVGIIDDDTVPHPRWARAMLSLLDDEPRAGIVGGPVRIVWEDGPTRIAMIYKRSMGDQLLGDRRVRLDDPASFLMGASIAVRVRAVDESGWRTSRLMECRRGSTLQGGEDAELCILMRRAGWEAWYEPMAEMDHLIPGWRTTPAYIAKLRESICATEPTIRWIADPTRGMDWAETNARRAAVRWWKTMLFDWRPARRRVRLAERAGRVRGWRELLRVMRSPDRR